MSDKDDPRSAAEAGAGGEDGRGDANDAGRHDAAPGGGGEGGTARARGGGDPLDATGPAGGTGEAPDTVPSTRTLDRALDLVEFLRTGCPWDAAQTHHSLIPYLLEETHEVVDAIRDGDAAALEGELGDLLLNLAFQVVLGEEAGRFDRESVTARMEEKMRRRHPHLFGLGEKEAWETLKAREREGRERVLDGLARGMDPLLRAHRIQERVSGVGFDWSDTGGAWDKVAEELEEVRVALEEGDEGAVEEELGDLLFAVVNLTRLAGAHSDTVLDRANRKFHKRFEALEDLARERGISVVDAGLEVLDGLWDELKRKEKG